MAAINMSASAMSCRLTAPSLKASKFVGVTVPQAAGGRASFSRGALVTMATLKRSSASMADVAVLQRNPKDTGSTEVQIALCTSRIVNLTEHLKVHKKDFTTQRGLLQVLGQRRRLMNYLQKENPAKFEEVVSTLGIRVKRTI
jgi:small subunit ribosomal protein S15